MTIIIRGYEYKKGIIRGLNQWEGEGYKNGYLEGKKFKVYYKYIMKRA
jgi:hypothetical protein